MNTNIKDNHHVVVCGASEIDDFRAEGISHLIRITNTGAGYLRPGWFKGEFLQLTFGDVSSIKDAENLKTKAPDSEDVTNALDFSRNALRGAKSKLLVSCDYGASRSPAIALIVMADRLGPGREQEALQQVLDGRPDAIPNILVVELGDNLLHRNGVLRRSLDDLYEEVLSEINFLL